MEQIPEDELQTLQSEVNQMKDLFTGLGSCIAMQSEMLDTVGDGSDNSVAFKKKKKKAEKDVQKNDEQLELDETSSSNLHNFDVTTLDNELLSLLARPEANPSRSSLTPQSGVLRLILFQSPFFFLAAA